MVYVGGGDNYVSWIHIEDYTNAYVHALQGAANGRVVSVVDDEPMCSRRSMEMLASAASAPSAPRSAPKIAARLAVGPVAVGWTTQSARLKNDRAKRLLG